MSLALSVIAVVLLVVAVILLVALLQRQRSGSAEAAFDEVLAGQERSDRLLREVMGQARLEAAQNSQQVREDVAATLKGLGDSTITSIGQMGLQQKAQFDSFAQRLEALTELERAPRRPNSATPWTNVSNRCRPRTRSASSRCARPSTRSSPRPSSSGWASRSSR